MKQFKNLILLALVAFVTSCGEDFLSPDPLSAISSDVYYSDEEELTVALTAMYDGIQGVNQLAITTNGLNHGIQREYQLTEMRSDNTRTKSFEGEPAEFENYSVSTSNGVVFDYYRSYYDVIFRANTVLANLGVVSAANLPAFEGEAKFVRAYAYFNLVRLFGDVPLVLEPIGISDRETQFTRVAKSTIYTQIISDFNAAIDGLDNTYKGRASRAAAQGLLAKVHLTLGNYPDAQILCEAIINGGEFDLEETFLDLFYTELNDEIIFAIEFLEDDNNDSQDFSAEWLNAVGRSSGLNYVTADARAALDALGGNRTEYSYRQDALQTTQFQVVKYLPNGDEDLGIPATSPAPRLGGNDWIVLRYADVLLMHVEAILAGGEETTASTAIASFQAVRDRAGLIDVVTSITKQELLDERRVELAFENQRLFDLIRFGEAQNVLSAHSDANGYTFSATDLLLPIPQAERNLSDGLLEQNPGY